ncbi:putative transcriptional regulator, gntR ubiC families [Cupriavidus taiwanensis]|uniref:GntR family transcriptional regulator n=1 Tax=Cupriavidus taiwanensis TaxID=164546 RepID=A0A375CZI7_9BURK|nr:GntR family transcriptional regulator [Cupriavidus taiwanensis]SOY86422.1 putative transcriptional regulator, gntR ubiC families [Cupriavidus taiwanensis]SOY89708.1 putative transcriptional regulator, gntR ubiC families [Cupriavidus taiwanensis]SPD63469.1 GntR family transcriptional regulator [Cupriavidus taiwanensis]
MQRDIDPVSAALGATSPRHLDLARTLMQEIVNGNPPVGALLPTEAELCETWNLSRYAVRQAVQKLTNLGMVSRQAGVGTRVISDRPQSRFTQLMDSPADLVSYAKGTTLRTSAFGTVKADDTLAALLRCAPGARWLHIRGTRFDSAPGHEPIGLVDIYVDGAYGELSPPGETLDVPVYTMVEKQYGIKITRVEQEVQGWLVEGAQAAALQVPDKSAGLRIVRTYFLRDQAIIVTTGVHPASRFSYCSTYQLQQAGS